MKLEDIQKLWDEDCKIDKTELDNEALKLPYLHSKYWKFLVNEKMILKKKKFDLLTLRKVKNEYYSGKFAKEDYEETGWKQIDLKLLRQDIPNYIDSDEHIIKLSMEISMQEEKCSFIEDILKSIHNRGFLLKTAMDFIRFTNGG